MRTTFIGVTFLAAGTLCAQQYVISTIAGGEALPTPVPAMSVPIGGPQGVAVDVTGNAYFTNSNSIFKLDPSGVLTRVAGNSRYGYSGDGGPATSAQLAVSCFYLICGNGPNGLAVDAAGNIFVADSGNNRIRRISSSGIITTIAGGGGRGFSGDGGPAVNAQLAAPVGVAVDGTGNLFIADCFNSRIRKVSPGGIITTVAGNGTGGRAGDGGPATNASVYPIGVATDNSGNLFVADGRVIRKISSNGIIMTVAGNQAVTGFSGDGGQASDASLSYPTGLTVDSAGNLYIVDYSYFLEDAPDGNARIRKISAGGTITTVAGNGTAGFSGDGGRATSAALAPSGVAVDASGNVFVADYSASRIREVSTTGTIATIAGNGAFCCSSPDGVAAGSAQLSGPSAVALDAAGNLFIADGGLIRKILPSGIITTVAGGGQDLPGDGGPATATQLSYPSGLAVDGAGNLFIADYGANRVRKVSANGTISTVTGSGTVNAAPFGVAIDSAGNLYIVDCCYNNRVRKVAPDGTITTVVGNGTPGYSGDGGLAINAQLVHPRGVAVDRAGNFFVADSFVRKVTASGIITTLAGFAGLSPMSIGEPSGVAIDSAGNLFITEPLYDLVQEISPSGIVTTLAGTGTPGFSGDGGPSTNAQLSGPTAVAVDAAGGVYVTETGDSDLGIENNTVRVLRPMNQSIMMSAVVDAASERTDPLSPGKIVVIYGADLGPVQLIQNQASNHLFGTSVGGTVVSFNGIAAPILYTSANQVAAIVPYAISGGTAQVTVAYQGQGSGSFIVPVAASGPSIFTSNQTGAGQAAAINAVDGTVNTAANPVTVGGYISLYVTGEGQTSPGGVDGTLGGSTPPHPVLPVSVTIGGIPATVQYRGGAPGLVAGLMQVNVQIPNGVQPGGYVPVIVQVGDASTVSGAVWIAVSGN